MRKKAVSPRQLVVATTLGLGVTSHGGPAPAGPHILGSE